MELAILVLSFLFGTASVSGAPANAPIAVADSASSNAGLLSSYVSLSIELSSFPLFAGNKSSPNVYSVNLLSNIAKFQGDMPVIRVGGNSQDRAIFDSTLETPTAGSCAADLKAILCIGKSFFDSYGTYPNTRYSHGFNLAANNISGYNTLTETVPLACRAIGPLQLEVWELGNEPDLFRGKWRPSNWNESEYVAEWLNGTNRIRTLLQKSCPVLASPQYYGFMAPSFSSSGSALSQVTTFQDGLNNEHIVKQISLHNYITGATSPGVTLQGTLMNHSVTAASINRHVSAAQSLSNVPAPYILGELNSLYGGGAAGLSDVFGAGLWVTDFILYGASTGAIKRMHFHQSNGSPYSAWSPVSSSSGPPGTHAPYYGKLTAAAFLGSSQNVFVKAIPLPSGSPLESAYAAYEIGRLVRLTVLNLREYNSTSPEPRPTQTYRFAARQGSSWRVERLTAPGSDVKTGITFNGFAYEYDTLGKASRVQGTVNGEVIKVGSNGTLSVTVQDSEGVVISLT